MPLPSFKPRETKRKKINRKKTRRHNYWNFHTISNYSQFNQFLQCTPSINIVSFIFVLSKLLRFHFGMWVVIVLFCVFLWRNRYYRTRAYLIWTETKCSKRLFVLLLLFSYRFELCKRWHLTVSWTMCEYELWVFFFFFFSLTFFINLQNCLIR